MSTPLWSGCHDQVCVCFHALECIKVCLKWFHTYKLVWQCVRNRWVIVLLYPYYFSSSLLSPLVSLCFLPFFFSFLSLLSEKYSELYCLSFNPSVNKEEREESWNFIDLMADYKRMGVPNNLWVATAANSEYRVSCNVFSQGNGLFNFNH